MQTSSPTKADNDLNKNVFSCSIMFDEPLHRRWSEEIYRQILICEDFAIHEKYISGPITRERCLNDKNHDRSYNPMPLQFRYLIVFNSW